MCGSCGTCLCLKTALGRVSTHLRTVTSTYPRLVQAPCARWGASLNRAPVPIALSRAVQPPWVKLSTLKARERMATRKEDPVRGPAPDPWYLLTTRAYVCTSSMGRPSYKRRMDFNRIHTPRCLGSPDCKNSSPAKSSDCPHRAARYAQVRLGLHS